MALPTNHRARIFWALNAFLGVAFSVELCVPHRLPWVDTITLILAAAASLAALNRQLPLQNVLTAAFIVAAAGVAVHGFSARTAIPLGPIAFDFPMAKAVQALNSKTEITLNPVIYDNHGSSIIFYTVPWKIPFLWVVAIFSARGVGRLMLRPWRKMKTYGYWLIGVTVGLVIAFDVALEPFATGSKHWWHWQHTKIQLNWHGATIINYFSWGFAALLMLMLITPSLIKKQPGSSKTADYHPLGVWLGALLLFALGAASAGFWGAVAVDVAIAAATTFLAVRGAKW